jgi:hypothetical protein
MLRCFVQYVVESSVPDTFVFCAAKWMPFDRTMQRITSDSQKFYPALSQFTSQYSDFADSQHHAAALE